MLSRLALHHLSLLCVLAETQSITAAAGRLGITQSAVSHRLREAERRLAVKLTQRGESGLVLTPEGERLRRFAEPVLEELSRLEQDILSSGKKGQAVVRLGLATYSRYHWLPSFFDHLARVAPDLTIDLAGRATARPFASLAEGSVDVVMVYGRPSTMRRFRWRKLGSDPLVSVMSPNHRLAAESYVDSTNIEDERLFTYPLSVEPGFEWEVLLGRPLVPFRRMTPMPTPEAVIDLLRAGYGVGVFSRWAIEPELADGTLVSRPVGPEGMALDWWAVTRERDPEDGPAGRMADALTSWHQETERGLATLGFEGR